VAAGAAGPGYQPVLREPRDADDEAEDRREHDAEPGDQQRVAQSDPESAAVGRGAAVFDQTLADVEAGGVVPEAESRRDLRAPQILDRIGDGAISEKSNDAAQQQLIADRADLRIVEKRYLRLLDLGNGRHHPSEPSGWDGRR